MHDAVVVGAGPAGTVTASLLAKDHEVLVLEEHESSGRPQQCAGLVTKDVIDRSGVSPDVLSEINGANVHFPNGGVFEVRSKRTIAYLIDREDLDVKLAQKAMDAGADIRYSTSYKGHEVNGHSVKVRTSSENVEAKAIIGADGHTSLVSNSLGNNGPKEYIYGIQVDVRSRYEHEGIMDLRLGSEYAPGFFSWEIPFDDSIRIGLCIKGNTGTTPNDHLKKLLKMKGIDDDRITAKYSGKIPLGGRPRSFGDRTLLIGDSAGQVKPISGGGLYPILRSASVLNDVLCDAISKDDLSPSSLSRYEKGWKDEIGKELSKGYRIRKMFLKLEDKDLDRVHEIINGEDARKILDDIDLDHPSSVAWPMLRNPRIGIRFLPILMKAIL